MKPVKQFNNRTIEQSILNTIQYFFFFDYPPTFEEIYTFLKKKVSKKSLASILEKMKEINLIKVYFDPTSLKLRGARYTLGEYSNRMENREWRIDNWIAREEYSRNKIKKIQTFLRVLSWFPQIQLVGLSGSVAMMNAEEKDDIDLFIVTAKNRLFTARIIALLFAHVMGIRRKRLTYLKRPLQIGYKDKVCLNLFFEESDLQIPKYKQTEYVGHEVLQMKPLINKNNTYERFLAANQWVFEIFPNAEKLRLKIKYQRSKLQIRNQNFIENLIEFYLKKLQLTIIKQHQTSEIVTNTQLWFHPEDFGEKLHKLL